MQRAMSPFDRSLVEAISEHFCLHELRLKQNIKQATHVIIAGKRKKSIFCFINIFFKGKIPD